MNTLAVHTLTLPNSYFEGHNQVYVIESDPLTLIDTGIADRATFDALQQAFTANGLLLERVGRILLTHKHIDHIGNAWAVHRRSQAEILIHHSEVQSVTHVDPDGTRYRAFVRQRLEGWNVPPSVIAESETAQAPRWRIESAPATGLDDNQTIDLGGTALHVIHTPGHTRGSICLAYGDMLFTGDHVLERITPNIGGGDLRHRGLLSDYLRSLTRIREMAAGIQHVMPGHGEPFGDLEGRCLKLIAHHQRRLERVRKALAESGPQTLLDIARFLYGSLSGYHVVLGCAEVESHLDYLIAAGVVRQDGDRFLMAE
jgi:glyoxylase-like metal-dependent hydrolase (beta-lactamase superfamily II)